MSVLIALTTVPDPDVAEDLARLVIEERLAACVNILGPVQSVYRWQGLVQASNEALLVIKTTAERYPALESFIKQRHPYELPEIVALPATGGLAEYLGWVEAECAPDACSI